VPDPKDDEGTVSAPERTMAHERTMVHDEEWKKPRVHPRDPAHTRKVIAAYAGAAIVVAAALLVIQVLPIAPKTRVYYIAADEVAWDYAPDGLNALTGEPFGPLENLSVGDPPDRVGHIYLKAQFREYLDANFTAPKPRPDSEAYMGIMGPVIRAEVGDTVRVVFRNNARYPFSMHPHGLGYDKASEGTPYADGSAAPEQGDDAVPPQGTHTYTWSVPERAGPGPHQGNSVVWMYHSHVDEPGDVAAGLMGPIVVYKRGALLGSGLPDGIDQEVFAWFQVFDENRAPYLWDNVARYVEDQSAVETEIAIAGMESTTGGPCGREPTPALQRQCMREDLFTESNLKHAINGVLYGNGPHPTLKLGQNVRWYLFSAGSEVDLHTPHWHGATALHGGERVDMLEMLPGSMMTVDMRPDFAGRWLFHCHVGDHIDGGMSTFYDVAA
jgi:FtsP/CotA-like multicopper oxidase with cupredoxin domain